jgi:hypothetical protein
VPDTISITAASAVTATTRPPFTVAEPRDHLTPKLGGGRSAFLFASKFRDAQKFFNCVGISGHIQDGRDGIYISS